MHDVAKNLGGQLGYAEIIIVDILKTNPLINANEGMKHVLLVQSMIVSKF